VFQRRRSTVYSTNLTCFINEDTGHRYKCVKARRHWPKDKRTYSKQDYNREVRVDVPSVRAEGDVHSKQEKKNTSFIERVVVVDVVVSTLLLCAGKNIKLLLIVNQTCFL
jgi:hypothetical protein